MATSIIITTVNNKTGSMKWAKNPEGSDFLAPRSTLKVAPDISVMEGYTDPGFVIQGQEGTRGKILGGIGSAIGGYAFGPLGGQVGGMIGSSFG